MARKRVREKKARKRRRLLDRLGELYLRAEDDAFLDLVVQVNDLDRAGLVEAYREVVDRTLWRGLGNGDLEAVEKLLRRPRADVDGLPAALLAAAVADIDAGRLDEARARLEALRTTTVEGRPIPRELLSRLRVLCDSTLEDQAADAVTALHADYLKLCRALDRYAIGELKRLPGNLRVVEPRARQVLDFVRALEAAGRARRPAARALARLRQTARSLLEGHKPGDVSETLALGALRFAGWLAVADELEACLRRRGAGAGDVESVLHRLRHDHDKLSELFDVRMPAALHGLRHLLEQRCRALLERLVELQGPACLARAHAATQGAFESMLEVETAPGGPAAEKEIEGESRTRIEKWATARSHFDLGSFVALARFCSRESAAEDDPCRLAMLWAVEVTAWCRAAMEEEDDDAGFLADPDEPENRSWRRLLARLRAMSGQLGRRLGTIEQRVQVARVLRRQLLEVICSIELTEDCLATAENLLQYLERDAALLLAALAAATETRKRAVARRFAKRIAGRGPASQAELESLLPFLSPAPGDDPAEVVTFLRRARPLFGEAWPQGRSVAVQTVETRALFGLSVLLEARDSSPYGDFGIPWEADGDFHVGFREFAGEARRQMRAELEAFRPLFGDERGFQVAELAIESAFEDASEVRSAVRSFLRQHTDLEAALAALRFFDSLSDLPTASSAFEPARDLAIEAVLSRLDHRWSLWRPSFEAIFPTLERKQLLLALNRMKKVLAGDSLDENDRQDLEDLRSFVEVRLDMSRGRPRRKTTRSKRASKRKRKPRPKPRRASGDANGAQLELFGPTEEGLP